jgi:DNA-binding NarL/FixJ family response regulator
MRTALDAAVSSPARAISPAAVIGGDAGERALTMHLLASAGFALQSTPEENTLIVVHAHTREDERLREIRAVTEAHSSAWLLVVMPDDAPAGALRRVMRAGATGIVFAQNVQRALLPTARAVLAGQLAVPLSLGRRIASRPLSHREKQILALVVLGLTNREIADKLYLAESTVKTHLSSAFRKIDVRSRSEAVVRIQDPESDFGRGVLTVLSDLAGDRTSARAA